LQKTTMSSTNSRPASSPYEESIVPSIVGIAKLLMAEFRRIAADSGLSDGLAGAMWHLHRAGQMKASDLARTLSCDMGNLSGTLDRLESADLVERVKSGSDRRVRLLQLTPKGRKLATQMENRFSRTMIHEELERMDARERRALSSTLAKLFAALSGSGSKDAGAPPPQLRRLPA